MKNFSSFLLIIITLIGCRTSTPEQKSAGDTVNSTTANNVLTTNVLSPEEISAGWNLLFDGESLKGWRAYKNLENDSWEVIDGTLHCKPFRDDGENKRSDLMTTEQFENFEFKFDWKVAPQANSGVIYRVSEKLDEPYQTGPEYQIIDDEGYPGDLEKTQLTGAVYHMYSPGAEWKVNPPGEWNSSMIAVSGNTVQHWLNGKKVVEYELQSEDWRKRITTSKWKDFPEYGLIAKGHIDLQDHRNEVWFRNLKIKKL
jgi:hypothetical protein